MEDKWIIAGKPDGEEPKVGTVYEIRDSRKGTFWGKIINVRDNFADVEVTKGKPEFISDAYKMSYSGYCSIRSGLCYLIEIPLELEKGEG